MDSRSDTKAGFKVHAMRTLGKPEDAQAKALLQKVAHQVQPIMRRREWVVPLLSEFFPGNAYLLGLNVGGGGGRTREVKVRLRPARDEGSFLPYESILGTMLHELVHNVRGPHDSVFYKLLDEITSECEELMAKGIGGTGVGFDAPSAGRLGSHSWIPTHNPPVGRLHDHARKAAEERAKRQRLMSSGPCRLGGARVAYATPAQAAAAAAERRFRDNLWCPCERLSQTLMQHQQQRQGTGGQGFSAGAGAGTAASTSAAVAAAAAAEEDLLVHQVEDEVQQEQVAEQPAVPRQQHPQQQQQERQQPARQQQQGAAMPAPTTLQQQQQQRRQAVLSTAAPAPGAGPDYGGAAGTVGAVHAAATPAAGAVHGSIAQQHSGLRHNRAAGGPAASQASQAGQAHALQQQHHQANRQGSQVACAGPGRPASSVAHGGGSAPAAGSASAGAAAEATMMRAALAASLAPPHQGRSCDMAPCGATQRAEPHAASTASAVSARDGSAAAGGEPGLGGGPSAAACAAAGPSLVVGDAGRLAAGTDAAGAFRGGDQGCSVIDLTEDDGIEGGAACVRPAAPAGTVSVLGRGAGAAKAASGARATWVCLVCTLENAAHARACDACGQEP